MRKSLLAVGLSAVVIGSLFAVAARSTGAGTQRKPAAAAAGIHKIKHVIVIMQENRSFDHYFGTYPRADGFPRAANGDFAICVPDPAKGICQKPYHDTNDLNAGGPHGQANATADVNGGKMDGFIAQAEDARRKGCKANPNDPICSQRATNPDVMGYHDGRDIPNYWAYARNFVLQDHMFKPNASWSLPAHLFMVSEWSARSSRPGDPMSCVNALQAPASPKSVRPPDYAWTELTYLLPKPGERCRRGGSHERPFLLVFSPIPGFVTYACIISIMGGEKKRSRGGIYKVFSCAGRERPA